MTTRVITTPAEVEGLSRLILSRKLPVTVTIVAGKIRTDKQNRLAFQWYSDVAAQLGDRTVEDVRGFSKLHFGVPIMRRDSEPYMEKYDRIIRPLPYETKIALMMEPYAYPVTSAMTTPQKTQYLDAVAHHWRWQGVVLTDPDTLKYA